MPVVSVLGGVVQDLYTFNARIPDDGETVVASSFDMQPGGKGSNSAVAIHRLSRTNPSITPDPDLKSAYEDLQVRMVGAVGTADGFGPPLKVNLVSCGVNVDGVREVEGEQTAVANILVEEDTGANRIMQFPGAAYTMSPNDFLTPESLGGGVVPDFIVAQLEIHRSAIEQAIETAYNAGIELLLNPSPARYLLPELFAMVSHLVMNETEAIMLSPDETRGQLAGKTTDDLQSQTDWKSIGNYFHDLGVTNVVITLGANGAYYSNKTHHGYVPCAKDCNVIDTSGAGDSFVGGYVATYMTQKRRGHKWDIETAVKYGCQAAARVIEHKGCLKPIAWANEVWKPQNETTEDGVDSIPNDTSATAATEIPPIEGKPIPPIEDSKPTQPVKDSKPIPPVEESKPTPPITKREAKENM